LDALRAVKRCAAGAAVDLALAGADLAAGGQGDVARCADGGAGFGEGGLPVGLQLLGNHFQEARLLNAAHRLQQATDFHLRRPEGF